MLWRRLGLNRAIDLDDVASRPQLTTLKRKGNTRNPQKLTLNDESHQLGWQSALNCSD